jgi:hypothetical protein
MAGARSLLILSILVLCQGCSLSDHHVVQSDLGKPFSLAEMERLIDRPGPIEVETINSADWTVPLAGLLNRKSAAAREAHLADHPEPIHIFTHVVRHPRFGTYLIDTGVSQQLMDDPSGHGVSWVVRKVMPLEKIEIRNSIPDGVQGVFFTHLHVDHISGMPDIPRAVALYVGRSESTQTSFLNAFVRGTTTKLLDGKADLQEWSFRPLTASRAPCEP